MKFWGYQDQNCLIKAKCIFLIFKKINFNFKSSNEAELRNNYNCDEFK